jgi:hypothetical protein
MRLTTDATIPGFSAEQSWSMEMLIERAVSKGIAEGMASFQESNCAHHQDRTRQLETVVFGRAEQGIHGLDERMGDVEDFVAGLNRLKWLVVGSLIAASASLIGTLVILLVQGAAQ